MQRANGPCNQERSARLPARRPSCCWTLVKSPRQISEGCVVLQLLRRHLDVFLTRPLCEKTHKLQPSIFAILWLCHCSVQVHCLDLAIRLHQVYACEQKRNLSHSVALGTEENWPIARKAAHSPALAVASLKVCAKPQVSHCSFSDPNAWSGFSDSRTQVS